MDCDLTEKQSFVDLGCGNGLLVHILSQEGVSGEVYHVEERGLTEKQSFVDLGCGNGLLVHILSQEGVSGED